MKLFLYEMFVIQFLHGSSLQKNTFNCILMDIIIEVIELIIIHDDSIQVIFLNALDNIEN